MALIMQFVRTLIPAGFLLHLPQQSLSHAFNSLVFLTLYQFACGSDSNSEVINFLVLLFNLILALGLTGWHSFPQPFSPNPIESVSNCIFPQHGTLSQHFRSQQGRSAVHGLPFIHSSVSCSDNQTPASLYAPPSQ